MYPYSGDPSWRERPLAQPPQSYTEVTGPSPVYIQMPPPAGYTSVVQVNQRGVNHGLHCILTLATCGLWGFVWAGVTIADAVRR